MLKIVVYLNLCLWAEILISSQSSGVIWLSIQVHCVDENVWILISWLNQMPAELDLHNLQKRM